MKSVTILLTKYSDCISTILYQIGGHGYTHASLSLEENENVYYSFNYRGFCIETPEKHRRRGVKKSLSCRIEVSDTSYENIKAALSYFESEQGALRYTRFGVLCCILRLPFHWRGHYFCSQFVAELLTRSGAVKLKKLPELYLPNNLARELSQSGRLSALQYNPI